MKLTKETLKKIIEEEVENFNKFLQEKVDPKRFPTKLSQVNPEIAKQVTTQGKNDGDETDDAKDVNVKEYSVSELKPSQSSMNLPKSLGMLVAMINGKMPSGGNLGGFISSDNFIMDGHHRWVSTAMLNPKLKVAGYVIKCYNCGQTWNHKRKTRHWIICSVSKRTYSKRNAKPFKERK